MKLLKILILVYSKILFSNYQVHELDVKDVIIDDGYPLEVHHVTSEDGYILELHRIPEARFSQNPQMKPQNNFNNTQKSVVVLCHCLFCSSAAYVVLGPNGGLAYMLANSGYDVWMPNFRGNKYSRRHKSLSPQQKKFWKFSWHDIGYYDIPASLDYILRVTSAKTVDMIGYSMGGTATLVALSERPEYNKKVNSFTALAPAGYVGNTKSIFAKLSLSTVNTIADFAWNFNILELPKSYFGLKKLISTICKPKFSLNFLCDIIIIASGARSNGNFDEKFLQFYFQFYPESTSLKTLIHYYQSAQTGQFRKYDFGTVKNQKLYGFQDPPYYNLSRVTTKVNMIWSHGDELVVPQDVQKTIEMLPNVRSKYVVPDKSYSHGDFLWAKNAHLLVNKIVVDLLKNHDMSTNSTGKS